MTVRAVLCAITRGKHPLRWWAVDIVLNVDPVGLGTDVGVHLSPDPGSWLGYDILLYKLFQRCL